MQHQPNIPALLSQSQKWKSSILLEKGHYNEPLEEFHATGLEPDIKYTVHDDFATMTMVEARLGVSILAQLMFRRTKYDIICIPTVPHIYRELAIGFKDKDSLPIASKYFIKYPPPHRLKIYPA